MKISVFILSLLFPLSLFCENSLRLWYKKPATGWSEALPIGNAYLGAMVYGGVYSEEIQLNEETFWAGSPYANNNPNARQSLADVRRLIFERQTDQAKALIDSTFLQVRMVCHIYLWEVYI